MDCQNTLIAPVQEITLLAKEASVSLVLGTGWEPHTRTDGSFARKDARRKTWPKLAGREKAGGRVQVAAQTGGGLDSDFVRVLD